MSPNRRPADGGGGERARDAGYTGAHKYVKGEQELYIAEKRGKVKALVEGAMKDAAAVLERLKARIEHLFRVLKCQFGFTKVRYRGLTKNTVQLQTLLALANLSLARRRAAAAA